MSAVAHTTAFLRLVKVEHSVFALPFAYLAALTVMFTQAEAGTGFLASIQWGVLGLITVAMVAGRTFAMAANRVVDRHVDARNPRTWSRELVTGLVSLRTAHVGSAVSLVVFFAAAAALNPLCLVLSPLAVVPMIVYPYGKRFTDFPHAILALAQTVAPVGAWLAVTGTFEGSLPAIVLGVAVGLWIGGFDLIYACQDTEIDREIGVRSFPARFGIAAALHTSTLSHVVTFALFTWFGVLAGFGVWFWIGLAITAVVFIYEHAIVKPDDLSRANRAFFTANGIVGIVLFAFAVLDLMLR